MKVRQKAVSHRSDSSERGKGGREKKSNSGVREDFIVSAHRGIKLPIKRGHTPNT